jgi:hypothetical protein
MITTSAQKVKIQIVSTCEASTRSRVMVSPYEASRSHSDTPHSVGILLTSDQTEAETSTWRHTTITSERLPCSPAGFEPATSVSERPQTHALARAATGIGHAECNIHKCGNIDFIYGTRFKRHYFLFFSAMFSSYELLYKYKSNNNFDCETKIIKVDFTVSPCISIH